MRTWAVFNTGARSQHKEWPNPGGRAAYKSIIRMLMFQSGRQKCTPWDPAGIADAPGGRQNTAGAVDATQGRVIGCRMTDASNQQGHNPRGPEL